VLAVIRTTPKQAARRIVQVLISNPLLRTMGLRATAEQANKKQSERGASCHGFFATGRERPELTDPI
jgi:hypothetical protein